MINMRNYFTFDGKKSSDYGVYISGSHVYDAPERDETKIEIPGRNGELTIDNGRYKNQPLKYPAFIIEDFDPNIEGLRNYLMSKRGYFRLETPIIHRNIAWLNGQVVWKWNRMRQII